jgi:hypothetical protein
MSLAVFKSRLENHLEGDLELVVTENRHTMLNVLEKRRAFTRLSIHKLFLDAPDAVLSAIAHYVKGIKKDRSVLRHFIQKHFDQVDYTHLIKQQQLETRGKIYNLDYLFDLLNQRYFRGGLDLSITWYGRLTIKKRRKSRVTFGQYVSGFPEYFVKFIIYHEMLHSVIPGSLDKGGRYCFHNRDFKAREKEFDEYERAIIWEKHNQEMIFRYGWT